jgi:branched-chain amino acid transport system substrate-binding protein
LENDTIVKKIIFNNKNMQNNKKIIWVVVLLIIVALSFWGFNKKNIKTPANPIKVGVILPLTGSVAVSGEKLLQGVQLAKKEFDSSKYIFVVEDDHSKTTDGITAAKKLLEVDKVDVLVGLYIPDVVVAVAPLAKEKNVTIFSASYCSDAFKDLTNVFCGYPTAVDQLRTVLPEIKKQSVKKVALVNTNDDFGINSRDGMVTLASDGGYSVVMNELVPFESRDLKTQAAKVISSKADAVFMASGDTAQAFTLMKLLKEQGFKGMRITFVDINKKALDDFGASVEGTFAPGMAPSEFSKDFTQKYKNTYGKNPEDYVVALGYDITKTTINIMQAGGFDKSKFVSEATKYKYSNPAISNFGYKTDRSINFGLELWTVVNGDYTKVK